MNENIVVTGATGFVGSSYVKHLLKGEKYNIFVIVRPSSKLDNLESIGDQLHFFVYDEDLSKLVDFFKDIRPNIVIHFASLFIAEHEMKDVDLLVDSNIRFGLHILEAMSVAGVRKFINTGTSWQHYNNEKYNPVCLYAATKQAFESLLEYYVEVVSFKAVTLELFDTYGENDTRPKLINLLHKISDDHIELNMSPGEQELNLIHISDVCNAYDKAIEMIENDFTENKHLKFDVSSDEVYKLKDIIDLFEKTSGKTINVVWGGRPYRKREVMNVWSGGNRLTNWKAKVKLSEGLKKYKG